jgi:hypothetical protein
MIESAESALLAIAQRNVVEAQRQRNVNEVLHEEEGEHCHVDDGHTLNNPGDRANQPSGSSIPSE